ncbi:hypothetical protein PGQ11_014762 [Apiospora arundinis]|uniref:Uncharacterized protein n=1 Tax=Apiospora arundinis TaxID=335852 RepID=A0ABR2HTG2_9PEZI
MPPARHRRPHPVDMALTMLGMATTFATWTQNMTCIRWRIGQGGFTVGYPNAMALAIGPIVYVVVYLLGFVLLGQMCEYAFFQNHFGNCLAGKASTPNLDVYSGALASCSEVFGHHDTYGGISSTFGDNQIGLAGISGTLQYLEGKRDYITALEQAVDVYQNELVETAKSITELILRFRSGTNELETITKHLDQIDFPLVTGKLAYVKGLVGFPEDEAIESLNDGILNCVNTTLIVLQRLEVGMDNTREQLKKLQHLTGRLFEGARYGLSTIQEEKEKRTSGDYVYAQVRCEWANLCGLLGPAPLDSSEVDTIVRTIGRIRVHSKDVAKAIRWTRGSIRSDKRTIKNTKHNLRAVMATAENQEGELHWTGNRRAIIMALRRGRTQLQKRLSELSNIRKSFSFSL